MPRSIPTTTFELTKFEADVVRRALHLFDGSNRGVINALHSTPTEKELAQRDRLLTADILAHLNEGDSDPAGQT